MQLCIRYVLIIFAIFFIGCDLMALEDTKLQKISIIKTNNFLDVLTIPDWVYQPLEASELKKLKLYVEEKGFRPSSGTEEDFVLSALSWVSSQWMHDGMNEPPKFFHALDILKKVHDEKVRYRCVEYGLVLSEVRSIPDTWVTVYSGDIGNTFNLKGSSTGSILLPSLSKYPRS